MVCLLSGVLRATSVSSMRRTKTPFVFLAQSQLKSAVRTPPMCRYPVGEGAKRTRTVFMGRSMYSGSAAMSVPAWMETTASAGTSP